MTEKTPYELYELTHQAHVLGVLSMRELIKREQEEQTVGLLRQALALQNRAK